MSTGAACPACGTGNLPGARYCRGCGQQRAVVEETAALTPDAVAATYARSNDLAERAWSEVRGVAWVFLLLITQTLAGSIAFHSGAPAHIVELAHTLVMALLTVVVARAAWPEIARLMATTGGFRGLLIAAAAFVALRAFFAAYFGALEGLAFPVVRSTDAHVAAGWPAWFSYLLIAAAPALTEELTFRGYVMSRLPRAFTATETLLVQAALFSLVHFSPVIFPSHFVMGVAFGLLRRHTGSLYPGMALHAAWNARVVWLELG